MPGIRSFQGIYKHVIDEEMQKGLTRDEADQQFKKRLRRALWFYCIPQLIKSWLNGMKDRWHKLRK